MIKRESINYTTHFTTASTNFSNTSMTVFTAFCTMDFKITVRVWISTSRMLYLSFLSVISTARVSLVGLK